MAGTLFQKDVKMKRVTTLGYRSAQGLNDPVRIRILEVLSHKQMTAEEIAKILWRSGYKKATTTIRHHLETLKKAGLIEVTKMVEVRGAVMKYYMSTLRAFSYNVPDLGKHPKLIDDTSSKLSRILKSVLEDKKFVSAFAGKDTCNLCGRDHYREYVALEILNAALAKTLETKQYTEKAEAKRRSKK
jgi:DNA-binding transcriptional ArsR family regulator